MMLTNRELEGNTNSFEARLLDTGEDYVLNSAVTEAREVAFPEPGLPVQRRLRQSGGIIDEPIP